MTPQFTFFLFCLTLMLLPLSAGGVNFEIGVVTFHPYTFMIILVLPFALWEILKRPILFGFRKVDAFIILLAAAYFTSTFFANDVMVSGRLAFHALFIPIITYVACKALIKTESQYQTALNTLLFSLTLFSAVTIYQFSQTLERPFVFNIPPIGIASLVVASVLHGVYRQKAECSAIWLTLQLSLSGMALIFTMSRVYIVLTILAPLLRKLLKSAVLWGWGFMLAGTLVLTLTVSSFIKIDYSILHKEAEKQNTIERVYNFDYLERALANRVLIYRDALKKFEKNLIFGTGLEPGKYQITTHNFHIEWLQYGGVTGYLFYLSVFMAHAASIRSSIRKDNHLLTNNLLLMIIMLNSVTNGFMHGVMPYVAYLLMGLGEARVNILSRMKTEEKNSSENYRKPPQKKI